MRRIIWISGWGVPTEWFASEVGRLLPDWKHEVLPPVADVLQSNCWDEEDWLGGYSLGAFLLLQRNESSPIPNPAILLAPFFAYAAEKALGGRVRRAQIRYLERWLQREPEAALRDFYERAGLEIPAGAAMLPYPPDDLKWGLRVLADDSVVPRLPGHWQAACGLSDPLLDAAAVHRLAPRVHVVPGAGHDPASLLEPMGNPPWPEV